MAFETFRMNMRDRFSRNLFIACITLLPLLVFTMIKSAEREARVTASLRAPNLICEDSQTMCFKQGTQRYFLLQKNRKEYLVQILQAKRG